MGFLWGFWGFGEFDVLNLKFWFRLIVLGLLLCLGFGVWGWSFCFGFRIFVWVTGFDVVFCLGFYVVLASFCLHFGMFSVVFPGSRLVAGL